MEKIQFISYSLTKFNWELLQNGNSKMLNAIKIIPKNICFTAKERLLLEYLLNGDEIKITIEKVGD